MNSIPSSNLIKITPFNKAVKDKILKQLPNLSEAQKIAITNSCWRSISITYQAHVKEKMDQMLEEMTSGKAVYEKQDFISAENEIFNKLLVKIDETQSQEQVQALKAKLKSPPPAQ